MGIRQCGVPLAGVVGALLLPAIALHSGYQWALAAAGAVVLLTCGMAAIFYREPRELQGERIAPLALLRDMVRISGDYRLIFITLTSMLLLCAQVGVMAFFTLLLVRDAGYGIAAAIGIFSLTQAAAMAGRVFWGCASDHIFHGSRALPLAVVCAVCAVSAIVFSQVNAHTPLAVVLATGIVLGFSAEGWLGVAVISMAETGGEEHSGSALGAGITGVYLAGVLSPAVFGAVAQTYGYASVWILVAILSACAIVPAVLASAAIRRALDVS